MPLAGVGIDAWVKAPQGCGIGPCHHQIPIAEVEVGKVVVLFRHQALVLVAQAEVQGQMGAHAPIILDEEVVFAEWPGDVLLKSVQPVLGKAQQRVGNAVPNWQCRWQQPNSAAETWPKPPVRNPVKPNSPR